MNIPLKRGMLIQHQNHIYIVADFQERHTGKQRPTVHVSLRDVRDGHPVDRTLADLEPIHEVQHALRPMQYLFARGADRVFMDSQTFEEQNLTPANLHGTEPFLKEGEEYRVMFVEGRPLALELPEIVDALRGEVGSQVKLRVRRADETFDVDVMRAPYRE